MITRIRNGMVISGGPPRKVDLWIQGEKVLAIGNGPAASRDIDAEGCYLFPGSIDPHVHMGYTVGEFTSSDDFASGTRAAAFGGVTTIIDFAVPEEDEATSRAALRRIAEATARSAVDFGVHAVVTRVGPDLPRELRRCLEIGIPDFKTFTTYDGLMLSVPQLLEVMQAVQQVGGLVMVHAEDNAGIQERAALLVHEGELRPIAHYLSRPADVEADAVAAVLELQRKAKCPVHFVHISAGRSVALIREARQRGADVSSETGPHYLVRTCAVYRQDRAALFMVSPAIKTEEDQASLWDALRSGDIAMAATDHCPFTVAQKTANADFRAIPTGLPGVETTLPILFTAWKDRQWPLEDLVDRLSANAAKRFGLYPQKGALIPGADADIVVYDPRPVRRLAASDLHMNVDWTPFEGERVAGEVRHVLLRGTQLIDSGRWVGPSDQGRYVHRSIVPREMVR